MRVSLFPFVLLLFRTFVPILSLFLLKIIDKHMFVRYTWFQKEQMFAVLVNTFSETGYTFRKRNTFYF